MNAPSPTPEESEAAKRFALMNVARIGAIVLLGAGLLIARGVIAAPYPLGVALALAGVGAFFFVPPLLAKRWKSQDRGER